MIVEGSITTRNALQLVVKVNHDFTQWHQELNLHTIASNEVLLHQFCTLAEAERHDRTNVVGSRDDRRTDIRFFHMINQRWVRHTAGVVHLLCPTLLVIHHITHVGHRSDDIHIKFPV